jgi:hypothetical protein
MVAKEMGKWRPPVLYGNTEFKYTHRSIRQMERFIRQMVTLTQIKSHRSFALEICVRAGE